MGSPDENLDPHSLPNLSRLLSTSAQKRNYKHIVHKGPSPASGLRESIISNISTERMPTTVDHVDMPLPTPPSSQSMDPVQATVADGPRLPISPPPEEEIRVKELSAHAHTPKLKDKSRLPVPSRGASSASFKFPAAPQSFAQYQQQVNQRTDDVPGSAPYVANAPPASSTNSRKRARSGMPPLAVPTLSPLVHLSSRNESKSAVTTTVAQSPNPKPRKQPKVHDSGSYAGSGFKRRHARGTSVESLNVDDNVLGEPTRASPQKSPARKKRTKDSGIKDYTPQRERASKDSGSSTKPKGRSRISATPDVPYEPPSEQFTPPRHVVLQPPASTTSTRSRRPRQSSIQPNASLERKVVRVKPERLRSPFPPPSIDLSKPTAPPSPTDDPILLIGPPVEAGRSRIANKILVDAAVGDGDSGGLEQHQHGQTTPVRASTHHAADESAWHMAPDVGQETALIDVGFDGPSHFDATFDPASDSDSNDVAPLGSDRFHGRSPRLDPDKSTGSHIFHSDDDEAEREAGEDEGEYTGRFTFYSVPVKQDPPSRATRERRESWGRPISPFPFRRRGSGLQVDSADVDDGGAQELSDDESPPPSPSDGRRRPITPMHTHSHTQARRSGGFTLSEMEARLEARNAGEREPASQEEETVEPEDTDSVDRSGEIIEEAKLGRGDMSAGAGDGHADEDVDAEEKDAEFVEREVTPMEETGHVGDMRDEHEHSEDEDDQEIASADEGVQPQYTPGDNAEAQDDDDGGSYGDDEEEHAPRRHISSSHQNSKSHPVAPQASAHFTHHGIALRNDDGDDSLVPINASDDEDGSSDEDAMAARVVEISSDDPMAAARAAAILKLHHSYIVDGVVPQRARRSSPLTFSRRRSFAFDDGNIQDDPGHKDMIRRAGRKSLADSGGVLQHRARRTFQHSPLARPIFVPPGSPAVSAISAEDALREAEAEIRAPSASPVASRTPPRSPLFDVELLKNRPINPSPATVQTFAVSEPVHSTLNQREWIKSDWKRLDMCFTDERIALAKTMALDTQMADVDDVEIDAVVDRFLATASEDWNRDMLIRRAKALSARQRAGQGAPPSPRRMYDERSTAELVVPVFTPPVAQRSFAPPSDMSTLTKIPPSLLAPRYAHLHEEVAVNIVEQPSSSLSSVGEPDADTSKQSNKVALPARLPSAPPSRPQSTHRATHLRSDDDAAASTAPASATKRVLSYLGSFIGKGPPTKTAKPVLKSPLNALPLPPPEMLQTVRGPVNTPAKKPIPKSRAPRELVQLTETLLPAKPSVPPKTKSAREMVSLNHIEPPRSAQRPRVVSAPIAIPGRTRKDSGGSVKDLVRSFEQVQRKSEEQMARSTGSRGATAMRKAVSVGDFKSRPAWKP